MSYMIRLHCQRADILSMGQLIVSKECLERFGPHIYKMLIKSGLFNDPDEIEIRLPFYRSSSTFWNISGGLCTRYLFMSKK